jgi:spore coat polysaccharide biosynthesis protein SpsF
MPLFEVVARRCVLTGLPTVLATTERADDDGLVELAGRLGIGVYRGETGDVVARASAAAASAGLDWFGRVNGDSPFVDRELLLMGRRAIADGIDLVTNLRPRTFPYGVAVEWVRVSAYSALRPFARPDEREHVTQHLYRLIDEGRFRSILCAQGDLSDVRMTVDTPGDLARINSALSVLGRSALEVDFVDLVVPLREQKGIPL